eukprot:gene9639-1734_t
MATPDSLFQVVVQGRKPVSNFKMKGNKFECVLEPSGPAASNAMVCISVGPDFELSSQSTIHVYCSFDRAFWNQALPLPQAHGPQSHRLCTAADTSVAIVGVINKDVSSLFYSLPFPPTSTFYFGLELVGPLPDRMQPPLQPIMSGMSSTFNDILGRLHNEEEVDLFSLRELLTQKPSEADKRIAMLEVLGAKAHGSAYIDKMMPVVNWVQTNLLMPLPLHERNRLIGRLGQVRHKGEVHLHGEKLAARLKDSISACLQTLNAQLPPDDFGKIKMAQSILFSFWEQAQAALRDVPETCQQEVKNKVRQTVEDSLLVPVQTKLIDVCTGCRDGRKELSKKCDDLLRLFGAQY